jgi:hypothetical protein
MDGWKRLQLIVLCLTLIFATLYVAIWWSNNTSIAYEGDGGSIVATTLAAVSPGFLIWSAAWVIGLKIKGVATSWFTLGMVGVGVLIPTVLIILRLFFGSA